MHYTRAIQLAAVTPTEALCGVWGISAEDVDARKNERTPLTVCEAGSLAALHGLLLEDVLSV